VTNARTVKSAREKAAEMRAEAARKETHRRSILVTVVVAVVLVVAVGVTVVVRQAQHDDAVAAAQAPAGTPRNVGANFGIATGPATTSAGKPRVVVDMYEAGRRRPCHRRLRPGRPAVPGMDGPGDRRLLTEVHGHADRARGRQAAAVDGPGVAEGGRRRRGRREGPAGAEVTRP
jgi:hypothetical protein